MVHTDGTPTIANSRALEASVPDFTIRREGDLYLVTPVAQSARNWVIDNVIDDETQFWGTALVIESRYVEELFDGIVDSGFTVA